MTGVKMFKKSFVLLKDQQCIKSQTGASTVEFIFAIPLFFILLFGIIEMSYVYRSKTTLNTATFEAARTGSVNNALTAEMRKSYASGMIALHIDADRSAAGVTKAYAKAKIFEKSMSAAAKLMGLDTIVIVSPNRDIFNKFAVDIPKLESKRRKLKFVRGIPNDNLTYRGIDTKRVKIRDNGNTKNVRMNVQDANILKIKSFWCHKLKVPGLRDIFYRLVLSNNFRASPEQRVCNSIGLATESRYIAITAQATVRMQSPVYRDNLR